MATVPISPLRSGGKYYEHSGELNARGLVAALGVGLIVAAALGFAYALVVRYVPVIKLNALACIVFGIALGLAPAEVMKRMKVRNLTVTTGVSLLVAVAGLYAAWVAWEWLLFRRGTGADLAWLAGHPQAVVAIGRDLYESGTWRMSKTDTENTKGIFLGIVWASEALIVLGGAVVAGRSLLRGRPFCEKCDRWCDGPTVVRRTAWAEPADVRRKLEAGDVAGVAALGPPEPAKHLEFTAFRCGSCGQLNTLSAATRTIQRDRKGRVRSNTKKTFVDNLLVTPAEAQKIATVPAAAPAVRPAS